MTLASEIEQNERLRREAADTRQHIDRLKADVTRLNGMVDGRDHNLQVRADRIAILESEVKTRGEVISLGVKKLVELSAIVDSLPKTVDGVPIVPGMEVWHLVYGCDTAGQQRHVPVVQPSGRLRLTGVMYQPEWQTYSTCEAAEAAQADLIEKSCHTPE